MKHLKKLATIVMTVGILASNSICAFANDDHTYWSKIEGTEDWRLCDQVGNGLVNWHQVKGKWYYMDLGTGIMHKGWTQVDGKWYYLDPVNGDMKTGWWQVDGKWYYMGGDGAMYSNTTTPDGYYVDTSGAWIPGAANQNEIASMRQAELARINKERSAVGLGYLSLNEQLNDVAQIRAQEITQVFSHTRPDGSDCFSLYEQYGFVNCWRGENIAMGYTTPELVMDGWMTSDGHRANILNSKFTNVGLGIYKGSDGYWYWVQCFSNKG